MIKLENVHKSFGKNEVLKGINLQIDTNEPGRIIGYHGKVLRPCNCWLKIIFITAIQEPSTLLLMSMIMLNTVQKSCRPMRKKLATRVLEEGRSHNKTSVK